MHILVMDCYNVGHIAFHAMGDLDYHGRRTGIIYGFMLRMLSLAKIYHPCRFVFCWDSQKSLRKLKYPSYKDRGDKKLVIRNTGEIVDYQAFHMQMEEIRNKVLPRLGFLNSYMAVGYEADDLMAATVNAHPVHPDTNFVLVTTDRDLYQVLGSRVSIYNMRVKKEFTAEDFMVHYGIEPWQWVEAKAMGGCDSDQVAGIAGVADPAKSIKSRALSYIRGDLTTGKAYSNITSDLGRYIIERNKKLIALPFNNITVPGLVPDTLSRDVFLELFDELGFISFLKKEKWYEWEKYFGLAKKQKASHGPRNFGLGRN